jgi:hypothetical protein
MIHLLLPSKSNYMKNLAFLIIYFALFTSYNVYSQSLEISGYTIFTTPVYFKQGEKSDEKIIKNTQVTIISADDNYFTIKYKDDLAYLDRNDVSCKLKDLRHFEKEIAELQKQGMLVGHVPSQNKVNESNTIMMTYDAKIDDPYKYEIDHIRYCAWKYNREVMTGYTFSIASCLVLGIGIAVEDSKVPEIMGLGLGLTGAILVIDSNKWMKRMYIGPNGAGIKYNF